MSTQDYQYAPICANQIRLLRGRRLGDGTLIGELKTFERNSKAPQFMALSYTWGAPVFSSNILLGDKALPVLASLYPVLRWAFPPLDSNARSRWWWIDSVCINQDDADEKANMLPTLSSIFHEANQVWIWLGEASVDSDLAIEFLYLIRRMDFWSKREQDRVECAKIADRCGTYSAQWDAVQSLFKRPWWNRVWTVQEQMSRHDAMYLCGYVTISQHDMYWSIRGIYKCYPTSGLLSYDSQWNRNRLLEFRECGGYDGGCDHPMPSLIATLAYVADHDATDPRDRVYSLSGLVHDFSLCGLLSYKVSVEDLYTHLVKRFIEMCDSLDVICFATIFKASPAAGLLPSWVPDWRTKVTPLVVPLLVSQGAKEHIGNLRPCNYSDVSACYSASKGRSPVVKFSDSSSSMVCSGICVSTIEHLTRVPAAELADIQDVAADWPCSTSKAGQVLCAASLLGSMVRCLVIDRRDHYLNHAAPTQRYVLELRTLASKWTQDKTQVPLWIAEWLELNMAFPLAPGTTLRSLLGSFGDEDNLGDSILIDSTDRTRFSARFVDTMMRSPRRLVRCANGKLATVPLRAQRYDIVCVLFGCSVPVVLREVEADVYEFVGECYVDGIMNGEALEAGIERQFNIR